MSVPSPTLESEAASAQPEAGVATIPTEELDRPTRWPVMFLFAKGFGWLMLAIMFGIICSIKLHAPGFLADYAWLTYGRVRPAFFTSLLFGFASQVGLGTALWMLTRLGRTPLQGAPFVFCAANFWNLGVAIGVIGILAGGGTGYEWLEMPRYAAPILFFSYVVMGICAVLTFHARRERELYPSQWYLLGALLWFPWIYATAQLLLLFSPVRGVVQSVVAGWSSHTLFALWLTPLGLATIFYFLPKLTCRPLYSRALAVYGFWILAIFGACGGVAAGAPVPRWLSAVSVAAAVLSVIGVLAVATNWHLTIEGAYGLWRKNGAFRFVLFGALCYVVASALQILGTHPTVSRAVHFTLYEPGVSQLYVYGFIAMTFSGALYFIVPRIIGSDWPSPVLMSFHFWTGAIGTTLTAVPLIVGGIFQGLGLGNAERDFVSVVRSTVPFLGMSTLGGVLLLAGFGAMSISLGRVVCAFCCGCCCSQKGSEARGGVKGGKS